MKTTKYIHLLGAILLLLFNYEQDASACTIFTASSGNNVFAGNNEDMCTTQTEIHLFPATDDNYGCVFWGFIGDSNFQGGMNEHGLFFDGAGLPFNEMPPDDLPEFEGRYIMEDILKKCKTVEEAIAVFKQYKYPYLQYAHLLIADATGDATIIEWGNNQMNYIRKGDKKYLIATNFNISQSRNIRHECERYNIVEDILSTGEPSLSSFERALSLSHQEGNYGTMYSQIGDLKNRKLYVYNFHDFTNRYEIDLTKDLHTEANFTIRDLFPVNFAERNFRMRVDCLSRSDGIPAMNVTFQLISDVDIPGSNISIRGSAAELGRWNKEGQTIELAGRNHVNKTFKIMKGTLFDYSIHADNCNYKAVDKDWDRPTPRVAEINSDTTIVVNISNWILKE